MPHHPEIARALGRVRQRLDEAEVAPGARIGVACSGGPDSVALLGLLHRLSHGRSLKLAVLHVDHGLRSSSAAEAELVVRLARQLDLPFRVTRLDLSAGPGLAARAREARYAALREMARGQRCELIGLGHTATDQIETVLMHLARGAGLEGLGGMATRARDLLRPLLDLARPEARELASLMELPFADDPTNLDEAHPRVALRRRVLPELRRLNPRLEASVAHATRLVSEAHAALEALATSEAEARYCSDDADRAARRHRWRLDGLHELAAAVRTRVLRRCLLHGGVDGSQLRHDVVRDLEQAALRFARHGAGGPAAGDLRPRRFDLHPRRVAEVTRAGLTVGLADRP